MKCNLCGQSFNPENLKEVGEHEHIGVILPSIKGKIKIAHPRDVYPYCSGEFAAGVGHYLNGNNVSLIQQENEEFRQGYYCAQRDLKDNYILNK